MKTTLVQFTPRAESRTKRLLEAYLEHNEISEFEKVDISHGSLPNLNSENIHQHFDRSDDGELNTIATKLIEQMKDTEHLVFATTIYNLGVPAQVKSFIDLVTRNGHLFDYTANGPVGMLPIKSATLVVTTGGVPIGADWDLLTPYLETIINFWSSEEKVELKIVAAVGVDGMNPEQVDEAIRAAAES